MQGQHWLYFTQLQRNGTVSFYNTNFTCSAKQASAVSANVATPQQLLVAIQLIGQLQPSSINFVSDMSVPNDWPGVFVTQPLVLLGAAPPAARTVLELFQVYNFLTLDSGILLTVQNILLLNMCGIEFVPNARQLPDVQYLNVPQMWSVNYARSVVLVVVGGACTCTPLLHVCVHTRARACVCVCACGLFAP